MNLTSPYFCLMTIAVALLIIQPTHAQNQKRGIVGQMAPEWTVSSWHQLPAGKQSLDVTDFRGKVTYLYFFQSWCPGCHEAGFPTLQKLSEKFKDDPGVAFTTIQTTFEGYRVNTADKLQEMSARYKLAIPFGQSAGEEGIPKIMKQYRTGGTPWIVIIDKFGKVRFNDFRINPDEAARFIEQLKLETPQTSVEMEK